MRYKLNLFVCERIVFCLYSQFIIAMFFCCICILHCYGIQVRHWIEFPLYVFLLCSVWNTRNHCSSHMSNILENWMKIRTQWSIQQKKKYIFLFISLSVLSVSLQRAEITRTYIKPPPNKTALDIPAEYNLFPSSTSASVTTTHHHHHHPNRTASVAVKQSKQNPIAKFLLRISSSKSNENNNSSYSACSSGSSTSGQHGTATATGGASTAAPSPSKSSSSLCTSPSFSSSSSSTSSSSSYLPTYTESQLMHQQQQQQQHALHLLQHQSSIATGSPSWSPNNQNTSDFDGGLKVTVNTGHGAMSRSTSPRAPSPNIYKSRSMCNSFSSISTLPTSMINNIVNNAATIGSSSSMSSVASCPDAVDTNSNTVSVHCGSAVDVANTATGHTNNASNDASPSASPS